MDDFLGRPFSILIIPTPSFNSMNFNYSSLSFSNSHSATITGGNPSASFCSAKALNFGMKSSINAATLSAFLSHQYWNKIF